MKRIAMVAAGLAMVRARSAAEFVDAATRLWVAPMQNMVVADRQGQIAVVSPGRVPQRLPEHDLKGLVPAPGCCCSRRPPARIPTRSAPVARRDGVVGGCGF